MKLIDTHFHVWDLNKQNLPWLEDTDGSITHTYTFDQFESIYKDVDFVGGIYVEIDGDDPIQEDEIVYDLMQKHPKILACMLRTKLEPECRLPIFAKGIREPLHIDSQPSGRCLETSFIEGLRVLAKNNVPFESCNRVEDLDLAYQAFSQVPEETVILNHLGNVAEFNEEYRTVMKKFAKLPNLYLKVSGFPTADRNFVHDVVSFVKETFDHDKLLYASNWPVVNMYGNFDGHLSILREEFTDDEDFFYNNAVAAYGLEI